MARCLIITPAYQEEENILTVIKNVKGLKCPGIQFEHLIINDGSRDKTGEIAVKEGIKVINHLKNKGYAGAIQTGYKYAVKNKFDYVLQIDADGQHIIEFATKILEPLLNDHIDLCYGSRFLKNSGYKVSFIRKSGILFYSKFISIIINQKITDCTSGYRAMNKKVFFHFAKKFPKKLCAVESLLWLGIRKFQIKEIPVLMNNRINGTSYLRSLTLLTYPLKMVFAIIRAFR